MILWFVLTTLVALVAVALTIPLVRRFQARGRDADPTLAVLADELAEIDAQVARGAIAPAEADALRTEVKRRMLAEARVADAPARPFAPAQTRWMAYTLAGLVALSAGGLYMMMGKPALPSAAPQPPSPQQAAEDTQVLGMIAGLETRLKTNPNDAEGWRMLGWSYFNLGRFDQSATAYARAVALQPKNAGFQSAWGEALVQAADGTMTPAAKAAFEAAFALDKTDARARFFLGVAKYQAGEQRAALTDWITLLRELPADAPIAGELRRVIEQQAADAKIDVSRELAAIGTAPAPAAGVMPAPTPEQAQAVGALPPAEQQAFIRQMVDGLAARLAENPRDAEGWQRLMRARMVLGDSKGAKAAYDAGMKAFAGDAATQAQLTAAARDLSIS
ncbi:c-type cytochrome biogenesis protein CcmI [Sandaracinobacteroides saxicola]|uniref:C-type cytochrome biogenesis protein CcmI n=1 Tax=Sandaracinobacteroides saxicola TaxID=2759707 RepID=A0A7G5IEZ8_9SPHN|nr:c-type cytochrome biogenesis protein CcmI [Sandaracinobacteroides saxicola]QMW21940.1 c-type cytochrome biogenesis protein CcmI [Sandaracinobacteroides saxicola]